MTRLFAVTRRHGANWRAGQALEAQADWGPHAVFMTGLATEGFVALGGPLEDTDEVLLIVRAADADEIRARLADDPWTRQDILPIARIAPWTLRMGRLD